MFPGIYDFRWDTGHVIFLGVFYGVLTLVLMTLAVAAWRAVRDFRARRADALRWHVDFEDLSPAARRCRHELTGETPSRRCPNGFDCRQCTEHPRFVAARKALPALALADSRVAGFELPQDRLYHRGHTWVRREADGTLTIGLDDLARRLLGSAHQAVPPAIASRIQVNGSAWEERREGTAVRILAPVDGEVVETGSPDSDWVLRVKPDDDDTTHLLSPEEARPWLLREVERLHMAIAPQALGTVLADGGLPVDDLSSAIPAERLDEVYGAMFLEP